MSFVAYNKETTVLLRKDLRGSGSPYFDTAAAAKAAITRAAKKREIVANDYAVIDAKTFFDTIEKKEIRVGIVGSDSKEFEVGVNTPWTSGPWSETYWCS